MIIHLNQDQARKISQYLGSCSSQSEEFTLEVEYPAIRTVMPREKVEFRVDRFSLSTKE